MVAVRQGSYTYTPIIRRRKVNRKSVTQASIQNIRILDITGWILQRIDKTTLPNNSVLGQYTYIRAHTEARLLVLIPKHSKKIARFPANSNLHE